MSSQSSLGIWEIIARIADLSGALLAAYALATWARQGFRLSVSDWTANGTYDWLCVL